MGFPGLRDRPSSPPSRVRPVPEAPGLGLRLPAQPQPGPFRWGEGLETSPRARGGRVASGQPLLPGSQQAEQETPVRTQPEGAPALPVSTSAKWALGRRSDRGARPHAPHLLIYFFLRRPEAWLPSASAHLRVCGPCERQHPHGNVSQARPVFMSCSSLSFTRSCPVRGCFPRLGGRAPSPSLPFPSCWD